MPYVIQPMQLEDVDEISRVERECFVTPWPASAYRREIRENRMGCYVVLRWLDDDKPSDRPPATISRGSVLRAVTSLLRPLGINDRSPGHRSGEIVGFAGMWLMFDEAHITTIGVLPSLRGYGLGEYLLAHLIAYAQSRNSRRVTLEVRVSNLAAQALYRKYTLGEEGVRKRYYSDNGEDALIMWSDRIDEPSFLALYEDLARRVTARVQRAPAPWQVDAQRQRSDNR